ncbi:hypothetical protein C8F04DRAFT_1223466 [Mycena alexandri]|uniref:Pre-mRNA polyadenylation factor Fip1 domain-containing protein n=1 Tax=Mycena alexandri TaxID=1745969 RepID=A0AAD6SBV8_9AGAR|nr:hypothetical protein C8F04DRAFT_1223466 [Mycena alexandri]
MDDDDDFLYGGGTPQPEATPVQVTPSTSLGSFPSSDAIVAQLEAQAEAQLAEASSSQVTEPATDVSVREESEEVVDMGEETEEDDEDDVEIIMEPQSRSLDFRSSARGAPPLRSSTSTTALRAPQPSLTTEYTPIQRAGTAPQIGSGTPARPTPGAQPTPQPTPQALGGSEPPSPSTAAAAAAVPQTEPPPAQTAPEETPVVDDGIDPSTLPPVAAPPSHPAIDPNVTGTMEGRSIIDVDLNSMTDKAWRRAGSDISDWFNYGFDELSWEAYCYRRRDLGELANVLKTNVLNFSGMAEDQLTVLPPEVRQMVMTGTTAMMNGAANPAMMGQGMMMDMGMMGPMGMGMNGDMGMNPQMMQMGMQEGGGHGPGQGQVGPGGNGGGAPEQGGMMQDGSGGFVGNPGMMGMGMEYGAQVRSSFLFLRAKVLTFFLKEQNQMAQQQMYPQMEAPQASAPSGPAGRGAGPVPYRGRGLRGARGFPGRGRGRGGYGNDAPPPPVRPTSPLPPNVPTGPRNQNKYKDRDNNAPAVDGLDYGGGKDGRMTSGEPEERSRGHSKRRSSPGLDDVRGSKRR